MVTFNQGALISYSKNKGKKLMYENKRTLNPDVDEDEFFYKLAHPIKTFNRSKTKKHIKEYFVGVPKPKIKEQKPLSGKAKKRWIDHYRKKYVKDPIYVKQSNLFWYDEYKNGTAKKWDFENKYYIQSEEFNRNLRMNGNHEYKHGHSSFSNNSAHVFDIAFEKSRNIPDSPQNFKAQGQYTAAKHERVNRNELSTKLSDRRNVNSLKKRKRFEKINARDKSSKIERFFQRP